MQASDKKISKRRENEAFWKNHYDSLKSSGMRRIDYCRENNLNYDRFGYWINRWNQFKKEKNPIQLIDVKLKSRESSSQTKILCVLDLKNGNSLKIYDAAVLNILLERCDEHAAII